MFLAPIAITAEHRDRARRIFVRSLHAKVQPKAVAADAGIRPSEWSRQVHGGQNLAAEVLVAQPVHAQIEMALTWLEELGAIASRTTVALRHAERVLRRMRMARAGLKPREAKEA